MQPYTPKPPAYREDPAAARAGSDELAQLSSALNQGPAAQRLSALQLAANGALPVQRVEEEEALQGKFVQRMENEEDALQGKLVQRIGEEEAALQGKSIQRMEEEEPLQGKLAAGLGQGAIQAKPGTDGGLPGGLRAGIESLSGMSMDGVTAETTAAISLLFFFLVFSPLPSEEGGGDEETEEPESDEESLLFFLSFLICAKGQSLPFLHPDSFL